MIFLERILGFWATRWYIMFAKTTRYRGGGPNEPWFDPIRHLAPISRGIFPTLAQEVGPLPETHKRFVTVLDLVNIKD